MLYISWKESFNQFVNSMKDRIKSNMKEKHLSYRDMNDIELVQKLRSNIKDEDWISVANYAFMLWEKEEIEKRKQASQRYD